MSDNALTPPAKALAYVRISSDRQKNNESPETQRDRIQQYADANNILIVEWFEDIAKTGKNADREGLQNMLKAAIKPKMNIDHVIVYNMRRASRDIDSYIQQVRIVLSARGITIRSATEPVVDDTKMGRFMENLLVLLGQLDNEGKAEVTIDNMKSLAYQGYWQHPPKIGYDMTKIPNDQGKLRPSMKPNLTADKVTAVLERFSVGDILKAELCRYAESIGLRSARGKILNEESINRLLSSPEHAGYVHDKFTDYELVEGKHPALISKATYERNQQLLYTGKNARKGEVHLKDNDEFIVKGLLLCFNCNNPFYASAPRTGSGGRSPRYHCARASCRGKVASVKAEDVHYDFMLLLERMTPEAGTLRLYKEILIREANNRLVGLNKHIDISRNRLSIIAKSRSAAISKFVEDKLTLDEKNLVINELDAQKLDVTADLNELEQQQSVREADIERATNFMTNTAAQWQHSAPDVKRRFQSMMFPEGLIYDSTNRRFGTKSISPLYRCIPKEKDAEAFDNSLLVAGAGLEPATSWL